MPQPSAAHEGAASTYSHNREGSVSLCVAVKEIHQEKASSLSVGLTWGEGCGRGEKGFQEGCGEV